jgi:FtsZ-binding cell division protein ZapB
MSDRIQTNNGEVERMKSSIRLNDDRIERLKLEIEEIKSQNGVLDNEIRNRIEQNTNIQKVIEEAPASKTNAIREEIAGIDAHNAHARKIFEASALRDELHAKKGEAAKLTVAIEGAEQGKFQILKNSALPVSDLTIDGDNLMISGTPFDDLSTSEQIKCSMKIGLATNPKLRVLRISRGRELDGDSMKEVDAFAQANDCQIWMEMVSDEPQGGIFIEDGEVKELEVLK